MVFGFICALLIAIAILALNDYVLKYPIPEFLRGWLSGLAYFQGVYFFLYKIKQKQNEK